LLSSVCRSAPSEPRISIVLEPQASLRSYGWPLFERNQWPASPLPQRDHPAAESEATARPSLGRSALVAAIWLVVWWAPVGALWALGGRGVFLGGIVTSLLLELTVYPAIFAIWRARSLDRGRDRLEATP
jgi:hypothetical protein